MRLTTALALLIWATPAAAQQAVAPPAGPLDGVYERGVVEVEPSVAPIEAVVIDNALGDVRIEGHDGASVIIHAIKKAPDDATLERLKVSLVPDPNGVVRIGSRISTGQELTRLSAGAVRIDLLVQAPRGAAIRGRVWNGALAVSGMENGAELSANEGDIRVESTSGRIVTHSASGRQTLHEIVGEVDVRGMMGELALDIVRGRRLDAVLHEGRVVARRVRSRDVSIRVTSGDITFEGTPQLGGRWSVVTYRGNIEVSFGRRAPMHIAARARRGTVELPKPLKPSRDDKDGWVRGGHDGKGQPADIRLAAVVGNINVNW